MTVLRSQKSSFSWGKTFYPFRRHDSGIRAQRLGFVLLLTLVAGQRAICQTCDTGPALDPAIKATIESAAQRYFGMSAQGDVAGLRSNAIPPVAADFGGIEQAVVTNKPYFSGGQVVSSDTYLLDASNSKGTIQRADFYCGIYNSPNRIGFSIPNLPSGKYAIAIQKISGGKAPITLTMVLQDVGGSSWKLAGYYPRLTLIGGHDGDWYLAKAREYKSNGQLHNAWFYYLTAWDLLAPVNFMDTPQLDKITDEMQAARPGDLPSHDSPLNLPGGGKVFKITDMAPVPMANDLDLRVRYQSADATNTAVAFADNMAVIKATIAKYPEIRSAFAGVIASAVDANGNQYGSLQAMKDVK